MSLHDPRQFRAMTSFHVIELVCQWHIDRSMIKLVYSHIYVKHNNSMQHVYTLVLGNIKSDTIFFSHKSLYQLKVVSRGMYLNTCDGCPCILINGIPSISLTKLFPCNKFDQFDIIIIWQSFQNKCLVLIKSLTCKVVGAKKEISF